jgi:outer membrane lipoprotein SlyB
MRITVVGLKAIFQNLNLLILISTMAIINFTIGCSTKRPILYPNSKLQAVGKINAEHDVDYCIRLSGQAGVRTNQGEKVFEKTAKGGVKGAAVGTAAGAVTGRVGRGAGVGAAARGMSGFIDGLFSSNDPDPIQRRFVEECLREKGYRPIGWQ